MMVMTMMMLGNVSRDNPQDRVMIFELLFICVAIEFKEPVSDLVVSCFIITTVINI